MATFLGFTNPSTPPDENPGHFPPLGNVGAPYMATLSLPGLTVRLPVWLFSTSLVSTVSAVGPSAPPPEQHHVEPKVGLSPLMPTSTSSSSTSPGESLTSSTPVAKKKKKNTKKKKSPKGEVTSIPLAPSPSTPEVEPPSAPPREAKFPCRLCKEDHLLRDCPGIPRVLDVWSRAPARPSPSHSDAILSVGKEKGKVRFPCRLCEGNHPLHLCPLMDKASSVLESLSAPSPKLPVGYQRLSATADHPPPDKEIDSSSSLVQTPLPKPGCAQPALDQPLVRKGDNSHSPPVDHPVSEESNSHVLLVSSESPELDKDFGISTAPETSDSVPSEQGGNHMIPPPSSSVVSFDWSRLTTPPFHPMCLSGSPPMLAIRRCLALCWMKAHWLVLCPSLLGRLSVPHRLCLS